MSDIFHKSCFTSRSPGYKYRTLSTNTGEKRNRDSREDNLFEKKFKELRQDIRTRIDSQVEKTQIAREAIIEKLQKLDAKIGNMVELQNTVMSLRGDIRSAEQVLSDLSQRLKIIDSKTTLLSHVNSEEVKKSVISEETIFEDKEMFDSKISHV